MGFWNKSLFDNSKLLDDSVFFFQKKKSMVASLAKYHLPTKKRRGCASFHSTNRPETPTGLTAECQRGLSAAVTVGPFKKIQLRRRRQLHSQRRHCFSWWEISWRRFLKNIGVIKSCGKKGGNKLPILKLSRSLPSTDRSRSLEEG